MCKLNFCPPQMPKRLNFNSDTPASAQRMSRSRQHSGNESDSGFASIGGGWTANRGIRKAPMSTARPTYGVRSDILFLKQAFSTLR